ncbi:MAG TPA: glycosyltransferase, partial [Magnetospirillum sp.]|nr:glycosyltransferase [Magnetospirillum sp.]
LTAEHLARDTVAAHPTACRPHFFLASLLADQGRRVEALPHFLGAAAAQDAGATALGRAYYEAAHAVQWDAAAAVAPRLQQALAADQANPFHLLITPARPAELRANAEATCATAWPRRRALAAPAEPKARLRVGYLSPDYRDHPVGHLVADLFRHHDRSRFDVRLYGLGGHDASQVGRDIRAAGDGYTCLDQHGDHAAARKIRADGIDVLIDLGGHTRHSRLGILSFRPAPLQMHYLGFPGTTGAPFVDYIVGDPWTIPPEHEPFFTEKIIRLPLSYQINSQRPAPAPADKARWGLDPAQVVFCSFNHVRKITAPMFDVWCDILARVPAGILWVLIETEHQGALLKAQAERRGIAPQRVHLARRLPRAAHLARLAVADLHLDTLPYNAHTTASDCLWVGCPLLTTPGQTFAGRVSAGLLAAAGLQDCIAADLDQYGRMASALGNDRPALAALKARTARARDGELFDPAAFTRRFERGLSQAWERASSGGQPASMDVAR